MSKQASGGNKKRTRRPRVAHHIMLQESRKERWLKRLAKDKKAQRKRKHFDKPLDLSWQNVKPYPHIRPITIENEYKRYRATKGHQGLNPNPKTRKDENPWVTHQFWTGTFPITELMEKPIQYSTPMSKRGCGSSRNCV